MANKHQIPDAALLEILEAIQDLRSCLRNPSPAITTEANVAPFIHAVVDPAPITSPTTPPISPQPPDPPDFNRSDSTSAIEVASDKPKASPLLNLTSKTRKKKLAKPLKYSCEEIYKRMENGLCLFCEELDLPGHCELKHRGFQIFMKDCDDDLSRHEEAEEIFAAEIVEDYKSLKQSDSLLEKETTDSNASSKEVIATHFQNTKATQQRELVRNAETIVDIDSVQEHELCGLTDSSLEAECVQPHESLSHFQLLKPRLDIAAERVWEPGGLPTKAGQWNWPEKFHNHGDMLELIPKLQGISLERKTDEGMMNVSTQVDQLVVCPNIAIETLLEIFGCENRKHMLPLVKQANRVWERGKLLVTHVYWKLSENCYRRENALKCCSLYEMSCVTSVGFQAYEKDRIKALMPAEPSHDEFKVVLADLKFHLKHKWRSRLKMVMLREHRWSIPTFGFDGLHAAGIFPQIEARHIGITMLKQWLLQVLFQQGKQGTERLLLSLKATTDLGHVLLQKMTVQWVRRWEARALCHDYERGIKWLKLLVRSCVDWQSNKINETHHILFPLEKPKFDIKQNANWLFVICVLNLLCNGWIRASWKRKLCKNLRFKYKDSSKNRVWVAQGMPHIVELLLEKEFKWKHWLAMGFRLPLCYWTDRKVLRNHEERCLLQYDAQMLSLLRNANSYLGLQNEAENVDMQRYNFIEKVVESMIIILATTYEYKDIETSCILLGLDLMKDAHKLSYLISGYEDRNFMKIKAVGFYNMSLRLLYGSLPRPPDFRTIEKRLERLSMHEKGYKLLHFRTGFWAQYNDLKQFSTELQSSLEVRSYVVVAAHESLSVNKMLLRHYHSVAKALVQWKEHPPPEQANWTFLSGLQDLFKFSSLRTRMLRTGEYCYRKSGLLAIWFYAFRFSYFIMYFGL